MNFDVCLQNIEKVRKKLAVANRPSDVISRIHFVDFMSVKWFYNLRLCQYIYSNKRKFMKLHSKQSKVSFLCPRCAKLWHKAVLFCFGVEGFHC